MKLYSINKRNTPTSFEIIFFLMGLSFGVLNSITVHSALGSAIVALLQYLVVIWYIANKRIFESFVYFLLFTAISLELDVFIFGDISKGSRYLFQDIPVAHGFLYLLLCVFYYVYCRKKVYYIAESADSRKFRKWLLLLLGTGIVSIVIGMILNDNNIMSSGLYPYIAIREIVSFGSRVVLFLTVLLIVRNNDYRIRLSECCILLLVSVVIVALIATYILGLRGAYGEYEIMFTPLVIGLTPCLLMFGDRKYSRFSKSSFLCSIIIIIATFIYPTCIGSKWYIIIAGAIIEWMILKSGIKRIGIGVAISMVLMFLIISNMNMILPLMGNEYVSWKLEQSLNLFSVLGGNGGDVYETLDHSTLFRIDELINTFIEYTKKPYFAVFGKGIAGTTLHHTTLLNWETATGAFSEEQVKMGAYFAMHETFAIIFLRHGIVGVVFIILTIKWLIKRITITPWAMVGLIWFIFYWSYGTSLIVGGVALILALAEEKENNKKMIAKEISK